MRLMSTALLSIALVLCSCGDDDDDHDHGRDGGPTNPPASVFATAQADPTLSSFVAAVQFASDNGDLVNLLSGPGTLTVFAPTNAAFDALAVELTGNPSAVGADLLTPTNQPLLRSVIQYHVLTKVVPSAAFPYGMPIQTAQGDVIKIDRGTPPVITDGQNRTAKIVRTDVRASNGVIHVIDRVLLPANKTVVQTLQALATAKPPEFTVLVQAISAADVTGVLGGKDPVTVFAPTDAAFQALCGELGVTLPQLLANQQLLTDVLRYHVVPGRVFAAEFPLGTPIATALGATITIDNGLHITDARGRTAHIVRTDVLASNGVIHVIDRVLLPQSTGQPLPGDPASTNP